MKQFISDTPQAHGQEEYRLAENVRDAVKDKNWQEVQQLLKKPLFNFLNNDLVK